MAKARRWKIISFLTAILLLSINGVLVGGRSTLSPVKTFKIEGGDIVDCIDIYKQPAFDHPLLKNHTIKMSPSDFTEEAERNPASTVILQAWQQSGSCPERTIPIRRIQKEDLLRASSLDRFGMKVESNGWEHALLATLERFYHGAKASLSVWGVHVEPQEVSKTAVHLAKNHPAFDTFVEAGWMVSEKVYGDNQSRFYAYWSGGPSRGCFDLMCPGFIQVSKDVGLGLPLSPLSTDDNVRFITISIYWDDSQKAWWLKLGDKPLGYWPASIVNNMDFVAVLNWGASVLNTASSGCHTHTQMGNGHSADDASGKAAQVNNVLYLADDGKYHPPPDGSQFIVTKPYCYDMKEVGMGTGDNPGYNFLYGGNAQNPLCV